jgi:hypothetical protein
MDYRRMLHSSFINHCLSDYISFSDHWQDVFIGGIIGTFVSYFTYRQYYPSLASELSHRPYSPRIKREEPVIPMHHHEANGSGILHHPQPQTSTIQQGYNAQQQGYNTQQQDYNSQQQGYPNPFTSPPAPTHNELHPEGHPLKHGGRYADHGRDSSQDFELEGTVMRPSLSLDQVWKDGEGELSTPRGAPPAGSAPAPQSRAGSRQGSTGAHERSDAIA